MNFTFKFCILSLLIFIGITSISSCSRIQNLLNNNPFKKTLFLESDKSKTSSTLKNIPTYTYKIVNTYPHDPKAFTQGLVFENGALYEGTGPHNPNSYQLNLKFNDRVGAKDLPQTGGSSLRKVHLETGTVQKIHEIPAEFFGEGITIFDDRIFQLTWKSHLGFVYNKETFSIKQEFTYPTQGWGITHDGSRLLMSDGSSTIYFRDLETFEEITRIQVKAHTRPISNLNELEFIKGEIYANIWQTNRIARISPESGQVIGWIQLEGLLSSEESKKSDVLNGIAYDAKKDRLFVTGKWWPKLFEIKLIRKD